MSGDSFLPTYVNDIQTGMNQLGNPKGEAVKTVTPVLGDFNLDGVRNAADIPAMAAALSNLSGWEAAHGMSDAYLNFIGDLNGDGKVDATDYNMLVQAVKSLPGDTNGDGVVNTVDLTNVLKTLGQSGTNLIGDVNGDGMVSAADLGIVCQNLGSRAIVTVPEPTTFALLGLGGVALAAFRRARNRHR